MKDIVIFDLDGTLADCQHRIPLITKTPKDWRAFFAACDKDTPIEHTLLIAAGISVYHKIWIVSGRSDEARAKTEKWLHEHRVPHEKLIMRKEGDYTDDSELKVSWLKDGTIPKERVICVFDDRKRVVDAWRAAGIPCYQVAPGDF